MKTDAVENNKMGRKFKINCLCSIFKKAKSEGRTLSKEKLFAECSIKWGLSERTFNEYLKIICISGLIQLDGDNILTDVKVETQEQLLI